jgi:2-polyprenyl-6-hydroxyphenyl methylase/3-demethylubiquinone-9 3-methyltransferase
MGLGTTIRHRLGAFELPAANLYRSLFINIGDLAATLGSLTQPKRILEIGCGDGTFANELVAAMPNAAYTGIDISPAPGRLFTGDRTRAAFRPIATGELLAEGVEPFDLVVIVDVLHHVPGTERENLLRDADRLTAPSGVLAIKDWERGRNVAHAMVFVADRYISGDRGVAFPEPAELRDLVHRALPGFGAAVEVRVPPWRNNVLLVLTRTA